MRSRLWLLWLVPLLLGAGQPIDPQYLVWDSSGGPDIVAGYEVVQGWDGAEVTTTVTGLSAPLAVRTGTAYAARVRALPVDPVATQPSPWATLAADWPDVLPQITSLSEFGRTTAPLPDGEPIMATFETYAAATVNGASLSVSVPTGTQNGDLMLAAVISNNWYSLANITPPAGWTLIGSTLMPGGAAPRLAVYSRIASSEPASYAWTSAGTRMTGVIARFSGVDGTTPIESYSNTAYTTSNTTVRSATVTTTDVNQTVVNIAGSFLSSAVVTYTPPTNYTEHVDYSGGTDVGRAYIEFSSRIISSAGSTGDIDATASATLTDKHGIALVLKNSGAAAAASLVIPSRQFAHMLVR